MELPAGKIIDAHHHLWRYDPDEYGWITPEMGALMQDFLPEQLEREAAGTGLCGSVVVQARQTIEETAWLLDMAGRYPLLRGVVGWFDLQSDLLESQLERFAGHPKLVGARHVIQDEPDPAFMLRSRFVRGLERLQSCGLVYDLLIRPTHLENACRLAGMFPQMTFVLDHLAKPLIRSGILQPWEAHLEKLAAYPNVWCKISGLVTEADHHRWRYEDFVPYLDAVLRAFGPDRVMLGSDWPVCRMAGSYRQVMGIPLRYIGELPAADRSRICWQNAMECYQIEASATWKTENTGYWKEDT